MPFTTLLQRLKLRHKIAALGVVGMALCTLPLIQLLRYQGLELQWARAAQSELEPAVLAVDLQRSLVDHRASAAQWLRGQRQAEPRRRVDQASVDARLAMLDHRLESTDHLVAQSEVNAMRGDWLRLVQRVVDRRCSVAESDGAHRLLVEQTLLVIDTVTARAGERAGAEPLRQAAAQARGQWRARPSDDAAVAQTLAAASAQVKQAQARQLARLGWQRGLAAAALLGLVLASALLLAWLRRAWLGLPTPPAPRRAAALPVAWRAPAADGQRDGRNARLGLLQRLRQPAPAAPRLEQPTEPQEP